MIWLEYHTISTKYRRDLIYIQTAAVLQRTGFRFYRRSKTWVGTVYTFISFPARRTNRLITARYHVKKSLHFSKKIRAKALLSSKKICAEAMLYSHMETLRLYSRSDAARNWLIAWDRYLSSFGFNSLLPRDNDAQIVLWFDVAALSGSNHVPEKGWDTFHAKVGGYCER